MPNGPENHVAVTLRVRVIAAAGPEAMNCRRSANHSEPATGTAMLIPPTARSARKSLLWPLPRTMSRAGRGALPDFEPV